MSHGGFIRAFREFGVKGTFEKLYKMRTLKFGQLVGTDSYGNQYYENTIEYPHPHHRWVEYAGWKNFYQVDASYVPPEWHGWLHHMTMDPPTKTKVGSTHKVEPIQNAHGSSAPYTRNLGGVISKPYPNNSSVRPRGYGLGNELGGSDTSAPMEEKYYTQPGYPRDSRNATAFQSSRRQRVAFSLKDTPLTLEAKAAANAGMTLEEYQNVTYDDSPAKELLKLTNGQITPADAEALMKAAEDDEESKELIAEALAAVPEDAKKRATAMKVIYGQRLDASDEGSFEAEVQKALTAEEFALWSAGADAAELRQQASNLQNDIDDYKSSVGIIKGLKARVEEAVERRDILLAKVSTVEAAHAKAAKVAAVFSAKGNELADKALAELV